MCKTELLAPMLKGSPRNQGEGMCEEPTLFWRGVKIPKIAVTAASVVSFPPTRNPKHPPPFDPEPPLPRGRWWTPGARPSVSGGLGAVSCTDFYSRAWDTTEATTGTCLDLGGRERM